MLSNIALQEIFVASFYSSKLQGLRFQNQVNIFKIHWVYFYFTCEDLPDVDYVNLFLNHSNKIHPPVYVPNRSHMAKQMSTGDICKSLEIASESRVILLDQPCYVLVNTKS